MISTPVPFISNAHHLANAAEILSQEIMLGKVDISAAVGVESMTNTPYYLLEQKGRERGTNRGWLDEGGLICEFMGLSWALQLRTLRNVWH